MGKKAISPLIATVLIIGFTVALAAVIMTWGQTFIKGMQETSDTSASKEMACATDVDVSVDVCRENPVDGDPDQMGDDIVKFILKNNGKRDLSKTKLRLVYTDDNGVTQGLSLGDLAGIGAGEITSSSFFDFSVGQMSGLDDIGNLGEITINKIEALPVITINQNEEVVCEGAKITIDFDKWTKDADGYLVFKIC